MGHDVPMSHLLTSTQAGAILGRSARTMQRQADAGLVPVAQKLPGPNGAYLFDRAVIEALAAQPEQASA